MEGPNTLVCKSIVPTQDAEVAVSKREVTSYKSIFGNVDRVREIVEPGAFASWAELPQAIAKGQIPTRHNHRELVGKMIHAEEDLLGLLTTEKYGTDPVSDRVFSLVRDRILTTSSFQASFKASDRVKQKGPDGEPVWVLKALRLREAGPADPDFAVNPETRVVAVKGLPELADCVSAMNAMLGTEQWCMSAMERLTPAEQDAMRMFVGSLPTVGQCVSMMSGAVAVGSRVRVKAGAEHDEETKGAAGTVAEMGTCALAVKFDGMDGVHKWYVADELEIESASDEKDESAMDDAAIGKAFQVTELYRAARLDGLLDRISHSLTKCRPSAAPN